MQNAKDSFYEVLRERLSACNPERTMVVRGVTRPAIVVDENESGSVALQAECFHVRWTGATVTAGTLPLITLECEVSYSTAGNSWNGGLDRGRVLAAMDAELLQAVGTAPQNCVKKAFRASAQGEVAVAMQSRIWWSDLHFDPVKAESNRLLRTASLQVMSFEEKGEL